MVEKMAFRPKLAPTLITIPAFCILVALGVWQLHRLEWKENLIDNLKARSTDTAVEAPVKIDDLPAWEFRHVTMKGHFDNAHEFFIINRSLHGNPGVHVFTPFVRSDADQTVLVNRGWVPFEKRDRKDRMEGLIEGETTVDGIIRYAKGQGLFTPDNEPQNNAWFFVEPEAMSKIAGADLPQWYVVDGNDKVPGLYPVGRQWRLDIRNDHLQYAITWFSLAVVLLVIYVVYHRKPENKGADD